MYQDVVEQAITGELPLERAPQALRGGGVLGTVIRVTDGWLEVSTRSGTLRAKRAFACLVEPRVDDRVLVWDEEAGEAYVLSVVARASGAPAVLTQDGDLCVSVPRGKLSLLARDGVAVVSAGPATLTAAAVGVAARDAEVSVERTTFLGSLLRAEVSRLKVVGEAMDSVFGRITQKAQRVFRMIEDIDRVQAKRIQQTAEEVLQMHAGNVVMTSEQLVKVDGEQIHLG